MFIHIHREGQNYGPYTLEELKQYLASGHVLRSDHAWYEGAADWQTLERIPALTAVLDAANVLRAQTLEAQQSILTIDTNVLTQGVERPEFSGFWRRLFAWLLDQLIVTVSIGVLIALIYVVAGINFVSQAFSLFCFIVAYWLYFSIQESGPTQATLGKRLLGIRVTDLQGERISFARSSGRNFAKIINWLTLGLGFILAALTHRKQALHDLMAGTQVLRIDRAHAANSWMSVE
jgi:uncharacterized RDD family membrane protein YckC